MRKVVYTFLFLCASLIGRAQQVQILPPLVNMPGCSSISDLYAVGIQNFDTQVVEAAMSIEISYTGQSLQNGVIAKGSLSGAPSFSLPTGFTQLTTGNIDNFFSERNLEILDPTLQRISQQSSCLPPGTYEICIGLYANSPNGQIDLTQQISQTCFSRTKENTNNIFLVSPVNTESLNQILPIFTWSPVSNFGAQGNYLFEIVEVLDYQTPFEAFRSNPKFFVEEGLRNSFIQYPVAARSFDPCRKYAWRVGYYEEAIFGNPSFSEVIEPSVLSEIWTFVSTCEETNFASPKLLSPPNLLAPNSPTACNQNGSLFFLWTDIEDVNVKYQLRIIEQNSFAPLNQALFESDPIFVSELTSDNFYYLQDLGEYVSSDLSYIWGVVPYDENDIPIFDESEIEAKLLICASFSTTNNSSKCPLEVGPFTVRDKYYETAEKAWTLIITSPETNEEALLVPEEVEINGQLQTIPPLISKWQVAHDNDPNWTISILKEENSILLMQLTHKSENFSSPISPIPVKKTANIPSIDDLTICLEKTFLSANHDCSTNVCIDLNELSPDDEPNDEVANNNCELVIQSFEHQNDISNWKFLSTNTTLSNGTQIDDYFQTNFSFETDEQPNRPDLYQRNQRIEFNTISSSLPLTFEAIARSGSVHKYAIVPDWGNIDAADRDFNTISFEVEACLKIDFVDADGNIICTKVECVIISNDVQELWCPIENQSFSVNQIPQFIPSDFGEIDPDGSYFKYEYTPSIDIDSEFTSKFTGLDIVHSLYFEPISSNVTNSMYAVNESTFKVEPIWYETDFWSPNELYFEFDVCLVSRAMYNSEVLCELEKCQRVTYGENTITECLLSVELDIQPDDNGVYNFYSIVANKNPDFDYTYGWTFSDGSSSSGESTINIFPDSLEHTVTLTVTSVDPTGKECITEVTKQVKVRPGCDWEACNPSCESLLQRSLVQNDSILLCGRLKMQITNINRGVSSNAKGQGLIWIPWLMSEIEVEFDGIKVNSNMQLCEGEILARKYDDAPTLPTNLATNVAYKLLESEIIDLNTYTNNRGIKQIPQDAVLDAAQDQVESLRVPMGFNSFDPSTGNNSNPNNKTNYTLSIAALLFTPEQNYLKAIAAVELNDEDVAFNGRLYFQSDHFFFNSAGPILSTGNSPDLGFEIIKPTRLQYGTNNGDPVYLVFRDATQENSWGTSLKLTSECNRPYKFCLNADIDIEMPLSWFEPIVIDSSDPLRKVKANTKIEFCDFKDIIAQVSLPPCHITNTNGLELEIQELTWDHSVVRNADSFVFPENYDKTGIPEEAQEFKGFFLKSARVLLPEELSTYSDSSRLEAELQNWIIHKGYGVTGKVLADNIVTFPDMNVSDLGGSIDTFRLEMINSSITNSYLKGEITLPICDYDEPGQPINRMDFKALYGSYPPNTVTSGLLFQITPQQNYECPFFANGKLEIFNTSNLYFSFTNDNSTVDFTLNGQLDFPNQEINSPIGDMSYRVQMDLDYENLNFNYTKPRDGGDGTVLFNHGVWSFASPQKKLNGYNFSIENFKSVTKYDLKQGELYAGGIGFDAVVNLGERIGGVAGLEVLGSIKKEPNQRLKAEFRGLDVSKIGLNANLPAVKLQGQIEFLEDPVYVKAVKGNVSAEFKKVSSAIYAGVLFGNTSTNDDSGYRYMQVQAKAVWPAGIPFLGAIALRGIGASYYKNMQATFDSSSKTIDVTDSSLVPPEDQQTNNVSNAVWDGVSFTPSEGDKGFKLQFEVATTPKEESFNGNLGLAAEFNSSNGISRLTIDGNVWSGAKIIERNKAFLTGNLEAYYDFTTDIFDLNALVDLEKSGLKAHADLKFHVNGKTNKYYFHFGTPSSENTVSLRYKSLFTSKMYLMFGNHNIYAPSNYIMQSTIDGLNDVNYSGGFPGVNYSNTAIASGKGFAAGIGIGVRASDEINIGLRLKYDVGAGAEFHLSMLDYGANPFCYQNSIGMNGYYLRSNLTAWALANAKIRLVGKWHDIIALGAVANLNANFPNPWGGWGDLYGRVRILGGLYDRHKTINFQFGTKCFPSLPSDQEIYEQEDVTEELYIFDQVFVDNGDQEYSNTKPLRWTTPYSPKQRFSLPEQQSTGSIKNRNFKVDFEPILYERDTTSSGSSWKYIDEDRYDPVWGQDPIGRWFHVYDGGLASKKELIIYKRKPDGSEFYGPNNWNRTGELVKHGDIVVGDFNGDGKDDILYQSEHNGGAIVRKGTTTQFDYPEVWTNELNAGMKWIVGNFNGDEFDDIGFYHSALGFRVALSDGSQFLPLALWSSEIEDFNLGVFVSDFNNDGKDDIYTYSGPNAQSLDYCHVYHSSDISESFESRVEYDWQTYQGDYSAKIKAGIPTYGYLDSDDEYDSISLSHSSDSTIVYLGLSTNNTNSSTAKFSKTEVSDIVLGDFNGDGLDDLLVHYPGTGNIQSDEILTNSLKPNTEYNFQLKGNIQEIGVWPPVLSETISRSFKTDANGQIVTNANSIANSANDNRPIVGPMREPISGVKMNTIPSHPPAVLNGSLGNSSSNTRGQ